MNKHIFRKQKGMVLVEVMIYVFLLSFLLYGFVAFAQNSSWDSIGLMDKINNVYGN